MMATTISDVDHRRQRAAKQARRNDRDGAKARYLRTVEEFKMAEVLVSKGERTPVFLEPFERARDAAAKEIGAIDNALPNELLNSCRDRDLKDQYEVARSLQSVARADAARAAATLKTEENSLAILKSGITQLIGEPAVISDGDSMPWDRGVIARTFSAMQIALGRTTVAKWAISADRQSVAFSPEVHETNVKHYADSWLVALRDIHLAQVSHDEAQRRLDDAQAAFAEVKLAMIESPI